MKDRVGYENSIRPEISQGDIFLGLIFAEWKLTQENTPVLVNAPKYPGMLLTHDCEYDKPTSQFVLIARILPLSGVSIDTQGNIRKNRIVASFYLPAQEQADFPECYVDLRQMERVTKRSIQAVEHEGQRILSLTEDSRELLQYSIAAFFGVDRQGRP